ncbi:MAG: hypothetical protein V3T14_08100 [Myxococcota bacterium]
MPERKHHGFLSELLREEAQLVPRLLRVFRFDSSVFREIEEDPNAIPGAFAVVLATSVLSGLGHPSVASVFLGIAGALIVWALSSALVWGGAALVLGGADYSRLLRCLGFAYAWNALALGGFLPFLGPVFQWAGLGLWAAALVLATREALRSTTSQALVICAVALALPVAVLFGLFR